MLQHSHFRFYFGCVDGRVVTGRLDLLCQLDGLQFLDLGNFCGGLGSQAATAPVLSDLLSSLVVVGLNGLNNLVEGASVTGLNLGDGHASGGLPSGNSAESSLVLDNAVGDSHLAAQGRQEENKLDGIDIISNDDQLSFLLLDQGDDTVHSVTDNGGTLGGGICLALGLSLGSLLQSLLPGLLSLRPVLVQQLEQLGGCLLVQGGLELLNWRRNLQTGLKDSLLSLQTDILGPSDKSGEISLGLDILADSKVLGSLFEKGVHNSLGDDFLDGEGGGRDLFASLLSLLLNHDDVESSTTF